MNLSINKSVNTFKNKKSSKSKGVKSFFANLLLSEYFVLYICIIYFLILMPFIPELASFENISNILSNMWPLLAIAIGQTVVMLIAGIDLSQTSILAFTSVFGALIMTNGVNPLLFEKAPVWRLLVNEQGGLFAANSMAVPLAIILMLLFGMFFGCLNGLSIAKLKMPAFMVTLVSQIFLSALAIYLTKSENVTKLPLDYIHIGTGGIGFISYALIIVATLGIVTHLILTKTEIGRWIFAAGTNIKCAMVSGIPTKKIIILVYTFSGFCAAVSAVLYSSRLHMGRPTLGQNILMDIIGATVIGGTSMYGGKGKVIWTLFGVLFFSLLGNTLNLLNLSFFTINVVKGIVILLAALADVTRTRILVRDYNIGKVGE